MDVPKYKAIKLNIMYRMKSGEFDKDLRLPSENEVATSYSVSRVTARKAFDELEKEELIYREHGRGTFMRMSGLRERQGKSKAGLRFIIEQQGFAASVHSIEKVICSCDDSKAQALNLKAGDLVLRYSRIYCADDIPVMFATSTINHKLLPGIENYDFSFVSFSEALDNFYPSNYYKVQHKIYAQRALEVAKMLQTDVETPIIMLTYLLLADYHNTQLPVEQAVIYTRTDIENFNFHVF